MKCCDPKNIKKAFLAKGSRCLGQRMVEDLNSRKLLLILSMMKITIFWFCHFVDKIFWKILIFFHFHKCSNIMKKMRCFRAISDNFKWVKWTNTFNPIKKNTLYFMLSIYLSMFCPFHMIYSIFISVYFVVELFKRGVCRRSLQSQFCFEPPLIELERRYFGS